MTHQFPTAGSTRANVGLDAANFFLADVRDGLGPYLAIYLLTIQKWDEASIGVVMSIATAAGIIAQTPAGGLIDATRAKRVVIAAAAIAVTAASLLLPLFSQLHPGRRVAGCGACRGRRVRAGASRRVARNRRPRRLHAADRPQRIVQSRRQCLRRHRRGRDGLSVGTDRRLLSARHHVDCEPASAS